MTVERDALIEKATWKAKRAIRRHGKYFLTDIRSLEYNGVTVVWKNDYNDGVFKIILRDDAHPPWQLIRDRWVNGKTTSTYDNAHLMDGLRIAMRRLDQLMVLDDLANV